MYNTLYSIIYPLFFGDVPVSSLDPLLSAVTILLCIGVCAVVVVLPVWLVVKVFKWVGYTLKWD